MTIAQKARLLNQPTRRDILTMLKQQGPIGIQPLADQLNLTCIAVRRHLYDLQKGGYVRIQLTRPSIGRPAYLYSLSEKASALFVTKYDSLALELIEEMRAMAGDTFVERLFERRKRKLMQQYASKLEGQKLEQRVQSLADIQEQEGYMARWGHGSDESFWLEEAHCPIAQVAAKHSPPCQCELALFADLLQADVERTECMADGGRKCMFRITGKRSVPSGNETTNDDEEDI
ncbi:transcriptional regulator [Paenibacillus dendritiformis]|uniref:helix-turn-helix transcriptional regulator n=1 Tax=Paenibacillus dendritiformis TaxID=130049 RepID=UPI0018CCEEF5|nr:HTH domain-containing protein [Paenibacillus dendritiformis]MBG9792711.1 transcriptional regulator [Paenibacillus dendritiformis]